MSKLLLKVDLLKFDVSALHLHCQLIQLHISERAKPSYEILNFKFFGLANSRLHRIKVNNNCVFSELHFFYRTKVKHGSVIRLIAVFIF